MAITDEYRSRDGNGDHVTTSIVRKSEMVGMPSSESERTIVDININGPKNRMEGVNAFFRF
jgi:hypothetical protein